MEKIQKSIEVNVPVNIAYKQWTHFEEFPNFMEGVKEVRKLDEKRLHWRAEVGGEEKEWDAEIIEQIPDRRISWHSLTGTNTTGSVTFHGVGNNKTQITLLLNYEPQFAAEKSGDTHGLVTRRVEGDLERFGRLVESRGKQSGNWPDDNRDNPPSRMPRPH